MGVHPWPAIDPASAYMTMTGGAGAAPMHVASAALSTLGGSVDTTVASSAVNTAATAENWSGLGSTASAASVTTLNTDQTTYGQLSLLKAQLLQAAGELHTMTPPRMVTHVQANANRGEYLVDNAINPWVWGALTPRLIDLDTEYFGFMWPDNASAGLSYGAGLDALAAALSALSALPSLAGGSVAAPAMAAADVAANAGITMASAAMSATEQAATAAISPATSAVQSGSSLLGQEPLSAPATSSGTPTVSPMANVQSHAPAMPSMGQAQAPAMTMFLPPSSAVVNPPVPAPPVQTMSPAAGVSGAAPPGVTSFVKPAEPFKAPPMPSGGQATGLSPGMLNASALRGPVSTMPLVTSAASSGLATATQPLAYVPPQPPLQPVPPSPPHAPPLNPGETAHTLNPPQPQPTPQAAPPTSPPAPPQQQPSPPAQPQVAPPAPSTGADGPGTGVQMLGTGPGGAPQAPQLPAPLDPEIPPSPPPPPVRGRAPDGIDPPVDGPLTPGPPSKAREQRKGAEHLWDDQGGEWRYHGEDSSHSPHWDYKPPGKNARWQQIPIGDLPPMKGDNPSIISGLPPWLQNPAFPGVPGPPQNPLLTPYPGATMPPLTTPSGPPPNSGLFPDFPCRLSACRRFPTPGAEGGEVVEGGGILGIIAIIGGAIALA